ncbi:MAG: HAD family phosphatase [Treponema sp.]|nr:HAD family phosphatase [Treponema sp.]
MNHEGVRPGIAGSGIQAVVFDYGKVICFSPPESVMDELAALAGLDRQILESLVWSHRGEYDRGVINGKDYYRDLLATQGISLDDGVLAKMVDIDLYSWTRVNPGTLALMEDIKRAGLTLGILSNMPREFLELARKTLPVFKLPDVGLYSCEAGFIKPEEAIYKALLSALGCNPEAVVFFDDLLDNVEKASRLGIKAFVWRDPDTARKHLEQLGLFIGGVRHGSF